jgi:hypothetical protein
VRDRLFGFRHVLVVAQAAEDTEWSLQRRHGLHYGRLRCGIVGEEVAGQRNQIAAQVVGDLNVLANFFGAHEGADVKIGKLDNAETFKSLREALQPDALTSCFEIEAAIEKAIRAGHKGGSA